LRVEKLRPDPAQGRCASQWPDMMPFAEAFLAREQAAAFSTAQRSGAQWNAP